MQTNQRLDAIEKSVADILQMLKAMQDAGSSQHVSDVPARHMIGGRNVMHVATRDGYSFRLDLLDMMFTPEELSGSLVYQPNPGKSSKKGLDKEKVSC